MKMIIAGSTGITARLHFLPCHSTSRLHVIATPLLLFASKLVGDIVGDLHTKLIGDSVCRVVCEEVVDSCIPSYFERKVSKKAIEHPQPAKAIGENVSKPPPRKMYALSALRKPEKIGLSPARLSSRRCAGRRCLYSPHSQSQLLTAFHRDV